MAEPFRVGLTRDALRPDGTLVLADLGLTVLEETRGVEWQLLPEHGGTLEPEHVRGFDALLQLAPALTEDAVREAAGRLAIVARLGVGYDNVPLDACTQAGIVVTVTPDAVRRPVATSALTLVLALSHRLLAKRPADPGGPLGGEDRVHGHGARGPDPRHRRPRQHRPGARATRASTRPPAPRRRSRRRSRRRGGARGRLVHHDRLFAESDFVCVLCQLNEQTHHLVDARRLALMKPSAYLVNLARGPVVDQAALLTALRDGRIAGAGLDVFEREPIDPDDPLLALDNVVVTPHALCWTDQCFTGLGRSACESVFAVMAGRAPAYAVNGAVLESRHFKEKLARYAEVAR